MRTCPHCGGELEAPVEFEIYRRSVAGCFQGLWAERMAVFLNGERVIKILPPADDSIHYRVWVVDQEWPNPVHPNKKLQILRPR